MLNLLTATGLRSIPLNTVSEIRLTNQRLNAELQDALAILTQVHSRTKRRSRCNSWAMANGRSVWATSRKHRCGRPAIDWC